MTNPQQNPPHKRRAVDSSSSGGGLTKVLMFGLIALALISSVLMLFLDSEFWLKLSVIAALWAACIGAVLVFRYSSALDSERTEARRRDYTYRAELDREKAEHHSREAKLAQEYKERESLSRDEHIEALRAELVQMRMQLAKMSGRPFSPEEQSAVQARAERIRELGEGAAERKSEPTAAHARPTERPTQPRPSTPTGPSSAATQSARTGSPLNPTRNATNRDRSNVASSHSRPSAPTQAPGFNTGSFAAVRWTGQDADATAQIPLIVDTHSMDQQRQQAPTQQPSQPAQPAQPSRRGQHEQRADAQDSGGRRRADESGGLTVAELMNRFKK